MRAPTHSWSWLGMGLLSGSYLMLEFPLLIYLVMCAWIVHPSGTSSNRAVGIPEKSPWGLLKIRSLLKILNLWLTLPAQLWERERLHVRGITTNGCSLSMLHSLGTFSIHGMAHVISPMDWIAIKKIKKMNPHVWREFHAISSIEYTERRPHEWIWEHERERERGYFPRDKRKVWKLKVPHILKFF